MGFKTCGPNELVVVSGCCHAKPKVLRGGRLFVWPGIQRCNSLSLNVFTISLASSKVYTRDGVAITVAAVAQVKIESQQEEMLRAAIQQFLGKSREEMTAIAHATLEGHQRAIMGTMTIEEIYRDRKKFAQAVFEVASTDLSNMGISIVSFTMTDIQDTEGYLAALGMKRTAEVKRDAAIGEAEAKSESGIQEARCAEELNKARFKVDAEIAKAERDYKIMQAQYDKEVQTVKADSELAFRLAASQMKQQIREEQMQILVVQRRKEIEVQEQEIMCSEKRLIAQTKAPAEAQKFKQETDATAKAVQVVCAAEADSQALKNRGDAQAFVIREKAKAEQTAMTKKAEAWKEYQDAAVVEMILKVLPAMAAEIASPLMNAQKITMVSTSANAPIGASKITNEILDIMTRLPVAVEQMTGVSVASSIRKKAA